MKLAESKIVGIFPTPVYITQRETLLTSEEQKEIDEIIENGMIESVGYKEFQIPHPELRSISKNKYIFNDKLKSIKEFCEDHIDNYVKEVIKPRKELEFYITQSWLNVSEPGGSHGSHAHQNSIISGVFYISSPVGDGISFYDPNIKIKRVIKIDPDIENPSQWSGEITTAQLVTNTLVLFPSWLDHGVPFNSEQTETRISLAFNVYFVGTIGDGSDLTELILK
jgi:uncharacterized protein (TIGR02466 family)